MRCRRSLLKNVERDCEGGKQHLGSTLVPCWCGGEAKARCGDMRFGIVLCNTDSEWKKLEEQSKAFCHTSEVGKTKRGRDK